MWWLNHHVSYLEYAVELLYDFPLIIGQLELVTTVTEPTPIRPIPTCLRPSRVIWITPEHPIPNPNLLTPSRLSNALPNTPTPLRLVNAFPTRRTFDLSSPSRQVDSRHPHPFPTRRSFDLYSSSRQVDSRQPHSFPTRRFRPSLLCVKSIPDVSSVSQLRSGEARSHTSLARCVLVLPFSLPIYMFPLCSSVTSLATLRSFSMSHPQFPISVYPCFIYLYPLPPSTLFSYSVHFLRPIPDRSDQPDPYHTHTCINTLVTRCCSSV